MDFTINKSNNNRDHANFKKTKTFLNLNNLKQGFLNWGARPPGGAWRVSKGGAKVVEC